LYFTCGNGHLEVARELLARGAAVDSANIRRWAPLRIASRNGHVEVVRVLLGAGADVGTPQRSGQTPLFSAAVNGHVEVANTWNGIPVPTKRHDLATYMPTPLYPNFYTFEDHHVFPSGIWGRISTEINVFNASGSQLLCARWLVFSTGTDKNETGWPYSVLFA
jgi:hypothetical protein